MKKRILTVLLALALLCSIGGTALGTTGETQAALTYRNITVLLDGKTLVPVDAEGNGVEPFILDESGSTYLPVRAIGNALGLEVGWDGATNTVILTSGGEVKNGTGEPLKSSRAVTAGLTYRDIRITLDGVELIPKDAEGNVVEPFILDENGTTYLPVRGVGSALGLEVGWDGATNTVTLTSGGQAPGTGDKPAAGGKGVTFEQRSVNTSEGAVSAYVLTVDTRDPAVSITPGITGGKLSTTAPVADIVAAAGYPLAVITGNFMTLETQGNYPLGNIMINGELIFTGGGISSIGVMEDGSLICGRPEIKVKVMPDNGEWPMWNATGVNVPEEEIAGNLSVVYTPRKGASFTAVSGTILSASGGVVNAYRTVAAGEEVPIPSDGFVYIMADEYMNYINNTFRAAVPGEKVHLEYYISSEEAGGGFTSLNGLKHMFSGGPRLVRHGEIFTEIPEPQFNNDGRFTVNSSTRTCAGITADGKLILVSSAGTTQAMRELMLALGCVEAVNLDGGASTALYYNGQQLVYEGRHLANTLRIYYAG